MKNGHRLRAPSTDGGLLAVPPLGEVGSPVHRALRNGSRAWDHDFQGRRAGVCAAWFIVRSLRPHATSSAAMDWTLPRSGRAPATRSITPLVVTGHQPELFHPGVWVKNFATAALARAHGGLGLNLIVDNDLPKSASIRVPRVGKDRVQTVRVEFDQWKGEMPYEDLAVHDEALFASFRRSRAASPWRGHRRPDHRRFLAACRLRQAKGQPTLGMRLALARHELESSLGRLATSRSPSARSARPRASSGSRPTCWPSFPDSRRSTTQALAEYRAVYGIRSKNHPVSALGVQGEWREAPFWVWRQGQPRRRPLLVRQAPRTMFLRIAGEDDPLIELPAVP